MGDKTARPTTLLERLRETWCGYYGTDEPHLVNPDGPEAADMLERLCAENAELQERLAVAYELVGQHKKAKAVRAAALDIDTSIF